MPFFETNTGSRSTVCRFGKDDPDPLLLDSGDEREARAEEKRRACAATSVQALWRGRSRAGHLRCARRRTWDGQTRDLEAVAQLFASRGAAFAAPVRAVERLTRDFLSFYRDGPLPLRRPSVTQRTPVHTSLTWREKCETRLLRL